MTERSNLTYQEYQDKKSLVRDSMCRVYSRNSGWVPEAEALMNSMFGLCPAKPGPAMLQVGRSKDDSFGSSFLNMDLDGDVEFLDCEEELVGYIAKEHIEDTIKFLTQVLRRNEGL